MIMPKARVGVNPRTLRYASAVTVRIRAQHRPSRVDLGNPVARHRDAPERREHRDVDTWADVRDLTS